MQREHEDNEEFLGPDRGIDINFPKLFTSEGEGNSSITLWTRGKKGEPNIGFTTFLSLAHLRDELQKLVANIRALRGK